MKALPCPQAEAARAMAVLWRDRGPEMGGRGGCRRVPADDAQACRAVRALPAPGLGPDRGGTVFACPDESGFCPRGAGGGGRGSQWDGWDEGAGEFFLMNNPNTMTREELIDEVEMLREMRRPRVFGEPSQEEFEPRDFNDADGVVTMLDLQ